MATSSRASDCRLRLGQGGLMLLFTPELCRHDPERTLRAALPHVDALQVRIKSDGFGDAPGPAAELALWTERVIAWAYDETDDPPPILVNDRVDVALALSSGDGPGCDGVHLGQDDSPPELARTLLGPDAVIGLSTHDAQQVAQAQAEPVDYLGFGPTWATETKGYERGLGPERAWVAGEASSVPVYAIGGVSLANASELADLGRAAVSAAILTAADPAVAARGIRAQLLDADD